MACRYFRCTSVSATATTYRTGWSEAAPQVWADEASWVWRGGSPLAPPTPLFAKLDPKIVEEELARLAE